MATIMIVMAMTKIGMMMMGMMMITIPTMPSSMTIILMRAPRQIGFVASFASKLSDTVSSEVGKAYGRTTYLATNFKVVQRGTEGAVSLEGTFAGIAAALAFSGLSLGLGQVRLVGFTTSFRLCCVLLNAREVLVEWLARSVNPNGNCCAELTG